MSLVGGKLEGDSGSKLKGALLLGTRCHCMNTSSENMKSFGVCPLDVTHQSSKLEGDSAGKPECDSASKLEGDSASKLVGSKLEGDSDSASKPVGSKLEHDSGSKPEGDSGSKLEGALLLVTGGGNMSHTLHLKIWTHFRFYSCFTEVFPTKDQ